jgi:hypothetical protein
MDVLSMADYCAARIYPGGFDRLPDKNRPAPEDQRQAVQ